MKKSIYLFIVMIISTSFLISPLSIQASGDSSVYVWPGRPGGNGDGSEEWLPGEYGETNGPWVEISRYNGTVASLNKQQAVVNTLAMAILGKITAGTSTACVYASEALTAVSIADAIYGGYEGNYYTSVSYISVDV